MSRFYADATIPDTQFASFEKDAFLGAVSNVAKRLIPRSIVAVGRKYTPTTLSRPFHPMADAAEKGLANAATRYLGPARGAQAARLLRGAPRRAVREGIGGAMIGGVLEGGINAATAEEGQGGAAFMRGLGSGALSGGASGVISGLAGGAVSNARRLNMGGLAKQHNLPRAEIARQSKGMGTLSSIKNSLGQTNNLNRQIARRNLAGGSAQFGAEMLLPMALLPGGSGTDKPEPPQMPAFAPNAPNVYSQPQYYKGGSVETGLMPIDFTKIPSYHQ